MIEGGFPETLTTWNRMVIRSLLAEQSKKVQEEFYDAFPNEPRLPMDERK